MKKVTRAISMLLVCVMALCLFTACGGSAYPNADLELLHSKYGVSYSIKQNKDLQGVADIFETYLSLKADAKQADIDAAKTKALAIVDSLKNSNATVKYIAIGNGDTEAKADATLEFSPDTPTPAEAADCDYYSIVRVKVVNSTVATAVGVDVGSYVTIVVLG